MIVGFMGQAGVGKDTAADHLVNEYGFIKIGLADEMKRMVQSLWGFDDETLWGESSLRSKPNMSLGGLPAREVLQGLGAWGRHCYIHTWVDMVLTNIRRMVMEGDKYLYVGYTQRVGVVLGTHLMGTHLFYGPEPTLPLYQRTQRLKADGPHNFVVPDVRYFNEVQLLRRGTAEQRGYIYRIDRPGAGLKGKTAEHHSETEQLSIPDAELDGIVHNDSTLSSFTESVSEWYAAAVSRESVGKK